MRNTQKTIQYKNFKVINDNENCTLQYQQNVRTAFLPCVSGGWRPRTFVWNLKHNIEKDEFKFFRAEM